VATPGSRHVLLGRELLRLAQEGAHPPSLVAHPARAAKRGLRLRRGLLQPRAPPLEARLSLARPVRGNGARQRRGRSARKSRDRLAAKCPRNRGQSNLRSRSTRARWELRGVVEDRGGRRVGFATG
jgi:hypothetical protein